jgi:predicted aspartyl protease
MLTVSGPYGQYTVEAIVDPNATYTSIPTPALVEMGIAPVRVVRVKSTDDGVRFAQLGRALTTVAGQEDVGPVVFAERGTPAVIGHVTLALLLLEVDEKQQKLVQVEARDGASNDGIEMVK